MNKIFEKLRLVFAEAVRVDEPIKNPYPKTVVECIDDELKYKAGTDEAMIVFRDTKPFQGSKEEKQYKFRILNSALAKIYEVQEPILVFVDRFPYGPCCYPTSKPSLIIMEDWNGIYSVSAFLHEFAHVIGKNEKGACTWSLNLFKRYFPKSFEKCDHLGHLLVKKKAKD